MISRKLTALLDMMHINSNEQQSTFPSEINHFHRFLQVDQAI